jgi:hypothetical protein
MHRPLCAGIRNGCRVTTPLGGPAAVAAPRIAPGATAIDATIAATASHNGDPPHQPRQLIGPSLAVEGVCQDDEPDVSCGALRWVDCAGEGSCRQARPVRRRATRDLPPTSHQRPTTVANVAGQGLVRASMCPGAR